MPTPHISEAELARDVHAVLEKVRQGSEVVAEQDHRAVAIMKPAEEPGRLLSESIAIARQREKEQVPAAVLDANFAENIEGIVSDRQREARHRAIRSAQPRKHNPPSVISCRVLRDRTCRSNIY